MSQIDFFDDATNEDSLLSCELPSLGTHECGSAQLESALRKMSGTDYPELTLTDDQYPWERECELSFMEDTPSDVRFGSTLTDLFLTDTAPRLNIDAHSGVDKATMKYELFEELSEDSLTNPRQMDLSPRSIVNISTPRAGTNVNRRSPFCLIRSSHSATAAAAAATAAMIVNDDRLQTEKRLSCSLLSSGIAKRPRIAEPGSSFLSDPARSTTTSISGNGEVEVRKNQVMSGTNYMDLSGGSLKNTRSAPMKQMSSVKVEASSVVSMTEEELTAKERARQCRVEALVRFRKKKAIRSFGRKVRYECRKRIATTRPRIRGKFAKKSDLEAIK